MHTKARPPFSGSAEITSNHIVPRWSRRITWGLALCLAAGLMVGGQCTPPDTDDPDDGDPTPPAANQVTIYTNMGTIVIELFPEQAPQSVARFLELIDDEAYYDNKIVHEAASSLLVAGAYAPDLQDGGDITYVNESNNGMKNTRGRVALYGPTAEDEGKPQFLINVQANPQLDFSLTVAQRADYTVIGKVVTGMDVVDAIADLDTTAGTSSDGDPLQRIPTTTEGHKVRILLMTSEDTELPENSDPVADAGDDQNVDPDARVTLDATSSTDTDDDPLVYAWVITDASQQELEELELQINLAGANTVNPTFTAPRPDAPITVEFELTVTDDRGGSSTDTVQVTISDNIAPTASAGEDKVAHPGDTVQLDGSGSRDPDADTEAGDVLSYAWTITPESAQLLTDRGLTPPAGGTAEKYSFTAPAVNAPVPLIFELTVTDPKGAQATDTVEVKILPISFNAAVSYVVGDDPSAIAAGDLDGDGKADIVVAKAATDQIAVFMNDGEGVLLTPVLYPVGVTPRSVVVADFNSDGYLDIAAATTGDSALSVLLNNGDGTFGAATAYAMGHGPVSLRSGDLDNASGPDVVAVNTTGPNTNSLSVKTNDGQGSFQTGAAHISITGKRDDNTVTPTGARAVAVGKVDNDALPDLVVAYADRNVFILLGDKSKTEQFRFGSLFEAGTGVTDPRAVALADIDNDARQDVAVALAGTNQLSVRKNNGSGQFGFEALYTTGAEPSDVIGADLDGDGDNDLAVTNQSGNSVSVFQNRGTGSFKEKIDLRLADADVGPVGLVAADLNGDDAMDLAVVNRISGTISILLNLTVSADAGDDQNVLVGETVTLHGIGKSRQGAVFTYIWTQLAGPPVTLSDPTAAEPTFTAPDQTGQLVFRLTATDDQEATATDTVIIDVYIQTPSGLKYSDTVKGTGALVLPTSTVTVLYTGRLNDRNGEVFDSTAPENEPREFALSGLIQGWQEGLGNYDMRVGGKRLLIIPPELGYGSTPSGSIPANSTLWFELEVLDVD